MDNFIVRPEGVEFLSIVLYTTTSTVPEILVHENLQLQSALIDNYKSSIVSSLGGLLDLCLMIQRYEWL